MTTEQTDSRGERAIPTVSDAQSQEEVQAILTFGADEDRLAEVRERLADAQSDSERANVWNRIQLEEQERAKEAPQHSWEREGNESIAAAETPEDLQAVATEAGFSADIYGSGELSEAELRRRAIARGEDPAKVGEQMSPEELDSAIAGTKSPQELERLMASQGLTTGGA